MIINIIHTCALRVCEGLFCTPQTHASDHDAYARLYIQIHHSYMCTIATFTGFTL